MVVSATASPREHRVPASASSARQRSPRRSVASAYSARPAPSGGSAAPAWGRCGSGWRVAHHTTAASATAETASWSASVRDRVKRLRDLAERLLHRRGRRSALVRLLGLLVLLVVRALHVDRPDVVLRAVQEVLHGAHRAEHRVVGVVVAVQAIAPDLLEVRQAGEPALDDVDALGVVLVVHRIRLRHADDVAATDLLRRGEPELPELARGEGDEV